LGRTLGDRAASNHLSEMSESSACSGKLLLPNAEAVELRKLDTERNAR
jgi:hypothetical protein